ncbi:MAG TPA: hypothetical protein VK666_28425 [Chryseolinea sp.]|nr:hypothetical protein [Chryseolinea sp.]
MKLDQFGFVKEWKDFRFFIDIGLRSASGTNIAPIIMPNKSKYTSFLFV